MTGRLITHSIVLVLLVGLFAGASPIPDLEKSKPTVPSPPSNFSIEKAEGRQSDEVYLTYLRKDRHLTQVMASVTIHYVQGEKPVVTGSWAKWQGGEKKTLSYNGIRQGRIGKVEFSATAREHSFKDGKETARTVTLTESKSFSELPQSPITEKNGKG